jgi:DNA-binding CsgD family transcriptional regulator
LSALNETGTHVIPPWGLKAGKQHHAPDKSFPFFLTESLAAFDHAAIGLAIADRNGRLLLANRVAEDILASRDGLEVTPTRFLRIVQRKGSAAKGLFDQRNRPDSPAPWQTTVLSVSRASGKRPLNVFVRSSGMLPDGSAQTNSLTFVCVVDPELPIQGMERYLRHAYKLTAAETHLATLLMQGNNLLECCRRMRVQRSTVATHLQQLFNKTQARTQSQLVSVLFRRIGLVGSRKPGGNTDLPVKSALRPAAGREVLASSFIRT